MAKKGKNQADFKPIGKALRKAIDDLKVIKGDRTGEVTRKQKAEVAIKIVKLELMYKFAESECCDGEWFCPCPDPKPHE